MAINKKSSEDNSVVAEAVANGTGVFDDDEVSASVAQAQNHAVAPTQAQVSPAGLSDEEMEDLEFGFGTFPIITLNGSFECADESIEVEDGFECVIQSYKARYIYRVSEDDFFYTYDNPKKSQKGDSSRITTSGEPFDSRVAEWDEEGDKYEIKKYLEVVVLMKGVNEGKICLLSVSPTSVGRFSGYVAMELRTLKNLHYTTVITKCTPGAKVKSKYSFNPWHFEFVSSI